MLKTILFDFDGTLADTLGSVLRIYNSIAPKYQLETMNLSEKEFDVKELAGKYRINPLKMFRIISEIKSALKTEMERVPLIQGLDTVLQNLKENGLQNGIITSNSEENVEIFLKKNVIKIDFIHAESNLFGKARAISHVLKEQRCDKNTTIYIGDEVRDIEAAHAAGIPVIAVTWGFNSKTKLLHAQPDFIVESPTVLLETIYSLQKR